MSVSGALGGAWHMANDWPAVIREVLTRQAFLRLIADYYSLSEWGLIRIAATPSLTSESAHNVGSNFRRSSGRGP